MHTTGPAFRLECKSTHRLCIVYTSPCHGRQLMEVACQHELQAAKRGLATPRRSCNALKEVHKCTVHHRDLEEDL